MKRCVCIFTLLLLAFFSNAGYAKRPITPEDLYRIANVSDPQISPDNKWIAFTITQTDLSNNSFDSDIWLVSIDGGMPIKITNSPHLDHSPRWAPDGRSIAFISNRTGIANIWIIQVSGGEATQLTHSKTHLSSPIWSKTGDALLCLSRIDPTDGSNRENPYAEELPNSRARTINSLLFRQWNRWLGDRRNHLFLASLSDGSIQDVTPEDVDVPPVSLTSGHDFDIHPNGSHICYVKNTDAKLALSTNQDIFERDINSGNEVCITTNPALDHQPHYSPNGRYIAYCAMKKVNYEADTKRLMIYDRQNGTVRNLTEPLDRSVGTIVWHPDNSRIYFTARDQGYSPIYVVNLNDGKIKKLTNDGYNTQLTVSPNKKQLVLVRSYCHQPNELYTMPSKGGKAIQLTFENKNLLNELSLPKLEDFWCLGAEGKKVHAFILKPPDFDPNKKYPAVLTIHGGPQNMWSDRFMTTWFTFPLVTAPGYVGIFPNPRGSSGYGAQFREEVSRDYGGRCYEDLMAVVDYAVEHYDFIDENKLAAIGGSFGGYSVNWILGQTDRFACTVSHASLYNLVSFYGATEELWFPAWDMGTSPWDEPELYAKWSPHNYAKNFKTPTLVTHGQKDYRVPVTESFQLFTTLQVQGIPSRLVCFPDEGHVISIPQNNVRWWKEMHEWLAEYLQR